MITHIQAILNTYLHALEAGRNVDGSHPAIESLRQLGTELSKKDFISSNSHLFVKPGWGSGNYTKVPWVAIFDRRVTTSAQEGVYPVFLFKADMSGFYLSMSAATGVPYGAPTHQRSTALAAEATRLAAHFQGLSNRDFGHLPAVSLAVTDGPGVGYEAGSIVHKFYAKGALPEEAALSEDLSALVQAYERAIDNGVIRKKAPDSESKTRCWIFQGNPDQFGVDEYLRTRDDIRWSVRQHREQVRAGDKVLVWRSGGNGGVVAVCVVQSEPDPLLPDDAPEIWHQKQGEAEVRCRLKVSERFIENPIRRETIKAVLPELSIIKAPQGTNFPLTEAEYETILALRKQRPEFSFAELLRRYHDETIIFCSSAHKRRYAITSYDDTGVIVERIDADEPQRVTFAQAEKLLKRVQEAGDLEFMTLDDTSAVRNTVLQAEPLALTADHTTITYLPDNPSLLHNFLQVLEALRQVDALYKPVMLLCVLDGIDEKELTANRFTFDWIAPRFIAKMKLLGKPVTEQQATQPFYHLSGDLFWLHSVQNIKDLMQDGRDGPAAARKKIKYALIKDTYWKLLQDPAARADVRRKLESLTMPKITLSQALLHAKAAFKATGFFHEGELVARFFGAIASKPFLILTGNSGTGKTKLAELFAQWISGDQKHRFAIVPVGADWTDNRNVLGFVNHLRPTKLTGESADVPIYQSTKILDLLIAAQAQPALPFLLILDEMNLSHVERYFSDFLSTLESKDGIILLHRENRNLPRKPGGPADVPAELALPRNVFVIGTVNVDETTYMFSPKVLDRANVLEFRVNTAAPKEFLQSGGRPVGDIAAAPLGYAESFLELSYRARGLNGAAPLGLIADPANPPADAVESLQKCHQTIADLFALMQQRHQEFAFRSMAEILRFLAVDYELTADKAKWDYQAAMDAQILQKILPKLHGSKRKIGSLLAALAKYCEKGDKQEAEKPLTNDTAADAYPVTGDKACKDPVFKDSHRKLCEMIESLRRDQFVSFIQ